MRKQNNNELVAENSFTASPRIQLLIFLTVGPGIDRIFLGLITLNQEITLNLTLTKHYNLHIEKM